MSNTLTKEKKLWDTWIKNKDNETANLLINKYFYLVNYHVERIAVHLPSSISKDDLKSLGLMGLYDALNKFDPLRDLKFDTYASFRIRGTIIDGLRKEDWLPRSVREKAKRIEQVSQILEQRLHREPTGKEIAKELSIDVKEVDEISKHTLLANFLSVEDKPNNQNDSKEGIGYSIPSDSTNIPDNKIINNENIEELVDAIQLLSKNEQMVISLFYKEELTLTEIGHVLDLTTSRISQIHKQALSKLRKVLSHQYN